MPKVSSPNANSAEENKSWLPFTGSKGHDEKLTSNQGRAKVGLQKANGPEQGTSTPGVVTKAGLKSTAH